MRVSFAVFVFHFHGCLHTQLRYMEKSSQNISSGHEARPCCKPRPCMCVREIFPSSINLFFPRLASFILIEKPPHRRRRTFIPSVARCSPASKDPPIPEAGSGRACIRWNPCPESFKKTGKANMPNMVDRNSIARGSIHALALKIIEVGRRKAAEGDIFRAVG